jgi:hypothetical protein
MRAGWCFGFCVVTVCLSACVSKSKPAAPGRAADTYIARAFHFTGPRRVAIEGPEGDAQELARALRRYGIVTVPQEDLDKHDYLLRIAGTCMSEEAEANLNTTINWSPDVMSVEAIAEHGGERLFAAHLADRSNCPQAFFRSVAAAINRNWDAPEEVTRPSESRPARPPPRMVEAASDVLACATSAMQAARDGERWHVQGCGRQVACAIEAGGWLCRQESVTPSAQREISPASPTAPSGGECEPRCRKGFVCLKAKCVSACNPPCADGETCDEEGECVW